MLFNMHAGARLALDDLLRSGKLARGGDYEAASVARMSEATSGVSFLAVAPYVASLIRATCYELQWPVAEPLTL
jgi:hypothetical protein